MSNTRVGIVVALYNKAPFIRSTIRSILNQSYPDEDYEVIVVDDASTDESVKVLRAFLQTRDKEVLVVKNEKNMGTAEANNKGMKLLKDVDLAMIMGADDLMMHQCLEERVRVFKTLPPSTMVVYENFYQLNYKPRPFIVPVNINQAFNRDMLLTGCYICGESMFRFPVYDEVGGFGYEGYTIEAVNGKPKGYYAHAEDYDLWLKITDKYDAYYHNADPSLSICYRRVEGSKSIDREGTDYCRAKVQELAKIRRGLIG